LLRPLLRSKLNTSNKLLIYKDILRPVWAYGIQIWGSAKPSNLRIIQAFQSICLRQIVSASWYIKNANLHNDLNVPTLSQLTKSHFLSFHSKLNHNNNPLIKRLSS
jgi:4-amino-4-deoxy-L-arabinose transferase-like glycosyltransferase